MGGGIVLGRLFPTHDFEGWVAMALAFLIGFGGAPLDRSQQFVGLKLVLLVIFDIPNLVKLENDGPIFIRRHKQAQLLATDRLSSCLHQSTSALAIEETVTLRDIQLSDAFQFGLGRPFENVEL